MANSDRGDDPIQRALDEARRFFDQANPRKLVGLVVGGLIALLVVIGLFTCFYTVQPEGEAVVKRMGKVVGVKPPGLHFKLPFGIDRTYFVPTRLVLREEFGFRTVRAGQQSEFAKTASHRLESLMLTGDLNVIDVQWVVQYGINDSNKWLHRVRNRIRHIDAGHSQFSQETIRVVAESVMRRIVGNRLGSDVLTTGRSEIAAEAKVKMQMVLDNYDMGVLISTVVLQDVTPPDPVKPAFNDVNVAEQEKERIVNESEKERNAKVPRATGEALQTIAEAEGYHAERVNRARGEADRFKSIYAEYKQGKDVTRRRLYIEAFDEIMAKIGKVYIVEEDQMSPLPLLNLGSDARPITDK